jgi:hypothetical protein
MAVTRLPLPESTVFPQKMLVDYLRVHRQAAGKSWSPAPGFPWSGDQDPEREIPRRRRETGGIVLERALSWWWYK